jgi:hypothetical protein
MDASSTINLGSSRIRSRSRIIVISSNTPRTYIWASPEIVVDGGWISFKAIRTTWGTLCAIIQVSRGSFSCDMFPEPKEYKQIPEENYWRAP